MGLGVKLRKKEQEERKKFHSYEGSKQKDLHIRLTNDMMSSDVYLSLSSNAKVLYSYMKLWAYKSNDFKQTQTFNYSISLAMKVLGVSNKTTISAIKELESKGFIERANNSKYSRETSKWCFSDRWYKT